MITNSDIKPLISLLEQKIKANEEKENPNIESISRAKQTLFRLHSLLEFSLPDIPKEDYTLVISTIKSIDTLIDRYSKTSDMGSTSEYDSIKKELSSLLSTLSSCKSKFDLLEKKCDYAVKKEYKDKIVSLIIEESKLQGENKGCSRNMAENKAEGDPRYSKLMYEYFEILEVQKLIENKYKFYLGFQQSVIQSIATARVGMIQDSYQNSGN